jgi:adenosylhomocysteine nucleosidase
LRPGDLIVSRQCLMLAGRNLQGTWHAPPAAVAHACELLSAAGRTVRAGRLLCTPDAILTAAHKANLWQRFGAVAVDMESAAVACAAAEAGVCWLACRAVCDPADRNVPELLEQTLAPDGRLSLTAVSAALLTRPRLALDMTALAVAMGRSIMSLRTAWRLLQASPP